MNLFTQRLNLFSQRRERANSDDEAHLLSSSFTPAVTPAQLAAAQGTGLTSPLKSDNGKPTRAIVGHDAQVCRGALIRIMSIGPHGGNGSGVLVSITERRLIATSSTVWNSPEAVRESRVFLDFEVGTCPSEITPAPDSLFVQDEDLGYVLVGCREDLLDGREPVRLTDGHEIHSGSKVAFWEHDDTGGDRMVIATVVKEIADDHMVCQTERFETAGAPGFQEVDGKMCFIALQCSYQPAEGLSKSILADHITLSANVRIPLAEMAATRDDAERQAQHCRALGKLAYASDRNKRMIVSANGIEHICKAMSAHLNDEVVQEEGCGALINIATGSVDVQNAIANAGGVRLICAALKAHEKSEIVQGSGCWALACIAADTSASSKSGVHLHIAEVGGVERICCAMNAHKKNAAVQVAGCRALANLAASNDADIQESITNAGAVNHICFAMQAHLNSAVVQKRACGALMHIAASSVDAQALIAQAGGIERICTAMAAHAQSEDVQEKGTWALVCLTGDSSTGNHVTIVKAGGIERICAAMAGHENCTRVQEVGLQCIARLSLLHRHPGGLEGKVIHIEGLRDSNLEHVAECGKCVIS